MALLLRPPVLRRAGQLCSRAPAAARRGFAAGGPSGPRGPLMKLVDFVGLPCLVSFAFYLHYVEDYEHTRQRQIAAAPSADPAAPRSA